MAKTYSMRFKTKQCGCSKGRTAVNHFCKITCLLSLGAMLAAGCDESKPRSDYTRSCEAMLQEIEELGEFDELEDDAPLGKAAPTDPMQGPVGPEPGGGDDDDDDGGNDRDERERNRQICYLACRTLGGERADCRDVCR